MASGATVVFLLFSAVSETEVDVQIHLFKTELLFSSDLPFASFLQQGHYENVFKFPWGYVNPVLNLSCMFLAIYSSRNLYLFAVTIVYLEILYCLLGWSSCQFAY